MGYVALVAACILIAVALNGGLGQSVSRRIEYPELLTAIREDNVKAVAIRGTSLVGLYRNGTVSDADFPERGYDFETTIGSDFIDTVRQMTATAQGKSLDEVSVSDLPFTVEYRAPVVTPWYMEFLPFILMIVITMAAWYFTMALGGHAAEHVSLDDIYTGASSDIKRATELCRRMVTQFGMSDSIGTMYLGSDQEVFVGMEFGQSREYSEQSAAAIDQEVKRLLDECYARACKLLKDHMDKLVAVAEALLERDTLTRADFECVMRGEPLPPMTDVEKMQPSSEAQADPTPDAQTDGAVTPGFATQDAQEDGDPFVEPKDGE